MPRALNCEKIDAPSTDLTKLRPLIARGIAKLDEPSRPPKSSAYHGGETQIIGVQ